MTVTVMTVGPPRVPVVREVIFLNFFVAVTNIGILVCLPLLDLCVYVEAEKSSRALRGCHYLLVVALVGKAS